MSLFAKNTLLQMNLQRFRDFSVLVVLLVGLLVVRAAATTSISFDASWWNGLTEDQQLFAVEGAIDAYQTGFSDGQTNMHDTVRRQYDVYIKQKKFAMASGVIDSLIKSDSAFEKVPVFDQTFGTYMHEITDFYANHPSATKATIGEIMSCLSNPPMRPCEKVGSP